MEDVLNKIKNHPIIPIYYNDDIEDCINKLDSCYNGGVRVFEFVNRGDKAIQNFEILIDYKNKKYKDLSLGIGTIKSKAECLNYLNLKPDFIVSPIVNPDIAHITNEKNILWIPGCMTPTEINQAENLNCKLIKLFPGEILGTKFLTAIKPIFPNLNFMPTGGVTLENENIKNWFTNGATAIGLGSKLFNSVNNDKKSVEDKLKQLFQFIKTI